MRERATHAPPELSEPAMSSTLGGAMIAAAILLRFAGALEFTLPAAEARGGSVLKVKEG